jgi:hypothetical protein
MRGLLGRNGEKYLAQSILNPESEREVFEAQIRECYGRVAYTHKAHEKMADICNTTQRRLKWAQLILSAATASGAVGIVFYNPWQLKVVTALLSLIALVLNGYAKDVNPGASAQKHREAAADIWDLRESYLSLIADAVDHAVSLDILRKRRDDLQEKLHALYKGVPHTGDRAYQRAQRALKVNEDLTFSDDEIDRLLPPALRRLRLQGGQEAVSAIPVGHLEASSSREIHS